MAIYDLFSKRKKIREKEGQVDVYQYDSLPQPFRVQVVHIWNSAIGKFRHTGQYEPDPASNGLDCTPETGRSMLE
jgi:hypothetical protein